MPNTPAPSEPLLPNPLRYGFDTLELQGTYYRYYAEGLKQGASLVVKELVDQHYVLQGELTQERHDAQYDGKTGLLEPDAFESKVREMLTHNRREGDINRRHIFMLLDLDKFKEVNENFGYLNADNHYLIPAAGIIKSQLRQGAIAGRFGGEEMTLFIPDTEMDTGMVIASRIQDLINTIQLGTDEEPVSIAGRNYLGASIGVVEVEHGADYDEIFVRSNLLLQAAKNSGRNLIINNERLKQLSED